MNKEKKYYLLSHFEMLFTFGIIRTTTADSGTLHLDGIGQGDPSVLKCAQNVDKDIHRSTTLIKKKPKYIKAGENQKSYSECYNTLESMLIAK
jgi:hypothetical protein